MIKAIKVYSPNMHMNMTKSWEYKRESKKDSKAIIFQSVVILIDNMLSDAICLIRLND